MQRLVQHVERFLEPQLVLEEVAIGEEGGEHEGDVALPEGVVRAFHQAEEVVCLRGGGGQVAAAPLRRDALVAEGVGVEPVVPGAEQVHQAEHQEGRPAQARLEARRLGGASQAAQEHAVR